MVALDTPISPLTICCSEIESADFAGERATLAYTLVDLSPAELRIALANEVTLFEQPTFRSIFFRVTDGETCFVALEELTGVDAVPYCVYRSTHLYLTVEKILQHFAIQRVTVCLHAPVAG